MLNDTDIEPLCIHWALSFLRQAQQFTPNREEAFNELYNVAYTIAKPLNRLEGASTWIMWKLVEYLDEKKKDPKLEVYLRFVARFKNEPNPAAAAEINEEKARLYQALAKLDQNDLTLLVLRFVDELTFTEIGKILGWQRPWTAIRIKNIIKKLREEMGCT